jgi:hypothetical protein
MILVASFALLRHCEITDGRLEDRFTPQQPFAIECAIRPCLKTEIAPHDRAVTIVVLHQFRRRITADFLGFNFSPALRLGPKPVSKRLRNV